MSEDGWVRKGSAIFFNTNNMIYYEPVKPILLRVPTVVSRSQHMQFYDTDNLYPQRCENAIKRSYTLRSIVGSVSEFLSGEGFVDPFIAKLIVSDENGMPVSLNKILMKSTDPFSRYKTIPLHIGYNLRGRISSITALKFEYIRLGMPDEDGKITTYKYCTNWELDGRKELKSRPTVYDYHVFNPDPENVLEEIEECGGIDEYHGQIMFLTPDLYEYPVATFDPVLDDAQTQSELGQFRLGYTQNGFMATLAMVYNGEFESEEEKKAFQELTKKKKGAKNANSIIGLQDKSGTKKANEIFQKLEPANLDRLFEVTEKSAKDAIMENEGWPKILIGVEREGGIINQQSMIDAYQMANAKTRRRRMYIAEVFAMLLAHWEKPIQTDAAIKELQYVYVAPTAVPAVQLPENSTPETKDVNPQAPAEQVQINENLKNLTGLQSAALDRILRKYTKGTYTREIAKEMLKSSAGFTDVQCDVWLPVQVGDAEDVLSYIIAYKNAAK